MFLEGTNQPIGQLQRRDQRLKSRAIRLHPPGILNVLSYTRYRLGNLVELQDCPAAVNRNESRNPKHWLAPRKLGSSGK
jgi:hypothetical protein